MVFFMVFPVHCKAGNINAMTGNLMLSWYFLGTHQSIKEMGSVEVLIQAGSFVLWLRLYFW